MAHVSIPYPEDDEMFTFDPVDRCFRIHVPWLYCESIKAPETKTVMQYCLESEERSEEIFLLAERLEELMRPITEGTLPKAEPGFLCGLESRCRQEARALVESGDLTPWHPSETAVSNS